MKTLKESLKMHESILDIDSNLEKDDIITAIKSWLDEYNIKKYKINDDYTIDVYGGVDISRSDIEEFPPYIQFHNVKYCFDCSHCNKLTSLRGAPESVGCDFICTYCKSLKTLEGAPRCVSGWFNCSVCRNLTSLEGSPKIVYNFSCSHCGIKSLEGCPEKIGGNFDCSFCDDLESLEGAPRIVLGVFKCEGCTLLKKIGMQIEKIDEGFACRGCTSLESLEGLPDVVKWLDCEYCKSLRTFKGCPKKINNINCSHCTGLQSYSGVPLIIPGCFVCVGVPIRKGHPKCKNIITK